MNPITSQQLIDALNWRYATKNFDPARQIPDEIWSALERALVLTPSSFGLQPYRFLVIDHPELRQKLLPHAWNQRQVVDAARLVVFAARTSVTEEEIDAYVQLIATTRGVSVESLSGLRGMMTGMLLGEAAKEFVPHWTARQAFIALGNLLTAAALLGVDASPMEGFVPAEFDRVLSLPAQGLTAVVCCALGYRAAGDKYATAPKVRFPLNELVKHL